MKAFDEKCKEEPDFSAPQEIFGVSVKQNP